MLRRQIDTETVYTGTQDLPDTKVIDDLQLSFTEPTPPSRRITMRSEPYRPAPSLIDAVNVAIGLGRPLLLQGEPGSGKTRLAYAIAYELGLPLEEGYIKSPSRAQDLLYTYDALNRLYDSQIHIRNHTNVPEEGRQVTLQEERNNVRDVRNYLSFGPLGRAIARAQYGRRSVVLIDEIDKADLDFPNDLLLELDRLRFQVDIAPEIQFAAPEGHSDLRPIVIVTHNEEKALPTAFLRRCVFHYVEFPETQEELHKILDLHAIDGDGSVSGRAIDVLLRLRDSDLVKKPGLSELIDWVGYMQAVKTPEEELDGLPYLGVLLKQRIDLVRTRERQND
jgi:MoxR-like ATPase